MILVEKFVAQSATVPLCSSASLNETNVVIVRTRFGEEGGRRTRTYG